MMKSLSGIYLSTCSRTVKMTGFVEGNIYKGILRDTKKRLKARKENIHF